MEEPLEIVQEEVVVEEQPKKFSEMTEEEKLNLPDEEFMKHLSGEEYVTEESKQDAIPESEKEAEEELTEDEEFERLSKLSPDEFNQEPKHKKGIFYAMKKERSKRQELQAELEKEREIRKAQIEVMEKLRENKQISNETKSEEQKVKEIIAKKAQDYENDYGEEYRLSYKDLEALETARKIDEKEKEAHNKEQEASKQRESVTKILQENIVRSQNQLKDSGIDDFDYVWRNFIEPIVNPEIAKNKDDAIHYAKLLANKTLNGENAMEFAYKHLARISPEGEKYFEEKKQKIKNKSLAEEATKKTTKTSSHVTTKASSGKEMVNISKLNSNFDYWDSRLSPDQFAKVVSGEEVYI